MLANFKEYSTIDKGNADVIFPLISSLYTFEDVYLQLKQLQSSNDSMHQRLVKTSIKDLSLIHI